MKYKVGDKVRVRADLRKGECLPFGVTDEMAAMAGSIVTISEAIEGSPDKYRLEKDRDGYSWCEQMFEPVEQFSRGGTVPTRGTSVFKPLLDSISMLSALEKCISLAVESEIGTKKSTGIESRKDIRKRLLKL